MHSRQRLRLVTPLITLCSVALAAEVEAADCGANDGNELLACIAQAAAGDTITMAAGTFEISGVTIANLHGTDTEPITLVGTVDGSGTLLSHVIGQSTGSNTIEIQHSSYLVFRDFELSHAAGATGNSVDLIKFTGAGEASHHVTIEGLDVHDCGNVAISSQAEEIHHITVQDTTVHDIGGSCFYWGYYENEQPQHQVHHSGIINNLLMRCPQSDSSETHYGIQLKSGNHDNRVEDNVLVDVGGTTRVGIAVYHNAPKPVGSPLEGSNVVRGNLVIRSRNEGINASAGAIIENNIVLDAAGIGIYLQPRSYGGVTYYGSLQVRNNTVVQQDAAHAIRFTHAAWDHADSNRPTEFTGNLAIVESGDGLRPPSETATVADNATNGNDNGAAATITLTDVLQAVVSNTFGDPNYLWPVAAGPLVDVGVDPAAQDDFNHTTRDGTPDVGAYEWIEADNPGWTLAEDELKPEGGSSSGTGGNGTGGAGGSSSSGTGGSATGGSGTGNGGAGANSSTSPDEESGCDCATGPGTGSRSLPWPLLLPLLLWRRRSTGGSRDRSDSGIVLR